MTIKQQGGVFGRNPSFNDVETNTVEASTSMSSPLIDTLRITDDGASGLRVYSTQPSGRGLIFASGIIYPSGNSGASNNNGTDLGSSSVRFKNIYAYNVNLANGGGIDFSATSGTGTSELFDDYEEGTWTPVAADASSGGNVAAGGTFTGHYVKIGNSVTAVASLFNVNTTGMTAGNDLYITGLPFTSKTSTGSVIYTGSVIMASTTTSGNNVASINAGDAVARIAENVSGGNADYITVGELSSGAADVRITITYLTE